MRRLLYSALTEQASADDRDCQLWSGNGPIVFDQNCSSGLYAASGYTLTIGPGLAIRGLGGDLDPQGGTTRYVIDPDDLGNVVGEYDTAGDLVACYDHGMGLLSRTDATGNPVYNLQHVAFCGSESHFGLSVAG